MRYTRYLTSLATLATLTALTACARPTPPAIDPAIDPAADPCVIGRPGDRSGTLRVLLSQPLNPDRAPAPTNDTEQFVFAQLYQTLVRIDCLHYTRPALATSWQSGDDGRRWLFTLAPDARFWDGTPVTDLLVLETWREQVRALSIQTGNRTITVEFDEPRSLNSFADPRSALVKHIPESAWPLGTGPYWTNDGTALSRIQRPAPGPATLQLVHAPGRDPRDLLDRDLDLTITRDPRVRDYAQQRPDWQTVPMPWDRIYLLAIPGAPETTVSAAFREDLASAVRGDARPATTESSPASPLSARRSGEQGVRPEIAYLNTDPIARDLAARLVARAHTELPALGQRPVATGLDSTTFHAALRDGSALGYIIVVPVTADRSAPLHALREQAPWFTAGAPLIESRAHLLVRGAMPVIQLDLDGTARIP